jgi:hypothetical protein
VRDYEGGEARLAQQVAEVRADRGARGRVQGRERFVEEQRLRLSRERPRERDPLSLAAGELARPRTGKPFDPEPPQDVVDRRTSAEANVVLDAQVREERVVLEHEADGALLGRQVDPRLRVEPGLAAHDPAALGPR